MLSSLRGKIHPNLSSFLAWAAPFLCHCHRELVVVLPLVLPFVEKVRYSRLKIVSLLSNRLCLSASLVK